MSAVKKNRLDEARIAKAYIAGGMPPYQAARKCGFMRVTAMEEVFRELEKLEAQRKEAAKQAQTRRIVAHNIRVMEQAQIEFDYS